MRFQDFLRRVIEESIKNCKEDFARRTATYKTELPASVAGLEACRDKSPPQLAQLLERARKVNQIAYRQQTDINRYWQVTAFMAEVEWVCNVVSVVLINQGIAYLVPPTTSAVILASRITREQQENN